MTRLISFVHADITLTLVVYDQAENLGESIERYQKALRQQGLLDIPFHHGVGVLPLSGGGLHLHDGAHGPQVPEQGIDGN